MVPCECMLGTAMTRLGNLLDAVEATKTNAGFVATTKKLLAEMRAELHAHQVEYKEQYCRAMVEIRKIDSINHAQQPLQTSVWTQGDERKMREEPEKKSSNKNKKPNVDGGVIVASAPPSKKKQKKK